MAVTKTPTIVIVGAGIIGLDVAHLLCQMTPDMGKNITIVAEHLPGDISIDYTSPYAGANFSSISGADANALRWDREGYGQLKRMRDKFGDSCFVKPTSSVEFWDAEPNMDKIDAIRDYLDDFAIVPSSELPSGVKFGIRFTTFTINAPAHLQFLHKHLTTAHGVTTLRRKLRHVNDAFSIPTNSSTPIIVFNCTGSGARTLPGVLDSACYPTRGQILLAIAPHITANMMRRGKDYETYIIPRPFSGGQVVLGGFMHKGVISPTAWKEDSESIWTRTTGLCPELAEGTKIVMPVVGLRPSRVGGARVERDERGAGRVLVHNYGAGGTGYQAGLGMAAQAIELAKDILGVEEIKIMSKL